MGADELLRITSPQRIGRYQIKGRIGRGAMGVVYHAWDEVMSRDVAVKVLTADLEDEPEIRARFRLEAQATARLLHPNIITILDVGEEADRFFIVMELLRGTVLKEFLKRPEGGRLGRKLHLMLQLCAGLGAAHRAAIYHRDIKPGNIFVRSDGLLKILDFGVARLATSATTSGFVVGTPDYMSPEQARGEQIDDRSDIFSMGGVFYFMLTGRKPFASTALPTLFQQIQSEEPAPIEGDVPRELIAVVRKALAKDPLKRYQNCGEVAAALKAVIRLYPFEPADTAPLSVAAEPGRAESIGAPPAIAGIGRDRSTTDSRHAATDDTVDFDPRTGANTDDTVPFAPVGWTARLKAGIGAIVAVAPRFGGSPAGLAAGQTRTRKR
jgi:serine/threonine protein kinase